MNGERKEKILEFLGNHPRGATISKISEELDISRQTAAKYLEILKVEEKVEVRKVGRAKIHYLKQETLENFAEGGH